jgi:VanZ family protein
MILSRPILHAARIVAGVLFWPALAFVIWGELTPDPQAGVLGWISDINDKVLHFFAYFGLAGLAAAALKGRPGTFRAVLGLIALGIVLEFVQGAVGRDESAYDALANACGAVLGGMLGRVLVEPLRERFPSA